MFNSSHHHFQMKNLLILAL